MSEEKVAVDGVARGETVGARAPGRRRFLGQVGAATAATLGAALAGWRPAQAAPPAGVAPGAGGSPHSDPTAGSERMQTAYRLRLEAARYEMRLPLLAQRDNGDEARYPGRIGSYSKGLPHDPLGEVDRAAYEALLRAVRTGDPDAFEAIPLGGPRKQVNPQGSLAFEMQGPDSHHVTMPAAPAFASAEAASEMVELYWMALARDVPFSEYDSHPLIAAACDELTRLAAFTGPRDGGRVTPATIFRAPTPGILNGPFISQFLLKEVPFGSQVISQKMETVPAGVDYMTSYANWLAIQNGAAPGEQLLDPVRRYPRSGRDLARWTQVDLLYQAYLSAAQILLGMGAPFDERNPYNRSRTQVGMGIFGPLHPQSLVPAVTSRAFKAIWYQKWRVHRRLRPEAFGGRIHNHLSGAARYPIHPSVLESDAVARVWHRDDSWLLPQAFVEGSPTHPSYAAGHNGMAGACITILKAFFDESFVIPDPVMPSADGLSLVPYDGPPLTVGGELEKVAWNIGMGRDFAGIHYRTDQFNSMLLGEEVALRFLAEEKMTLNERFEGFTLTKVDGTRIVV